MSERTTGAEPWIIRGAPVYKAWEPFKGLKNKSKWLDILKRFGLNWLPQNIAFNTEMTRDYLRVAGARYGNPESGAAGVDSKLPLTFSDQFLWNREFSISWDLTKNLHMNFQSATHAQMEEPYTPVNKDLYADQYHAWKDSVYRSSVWQRSRAGVHRSTTVRTSRHPISCLSICCLSSTG